ncbi:MAG: peptide chain release factor 2 [Bacilli bacterium]|nr:peptide chain release factor 2 [Bacilli bacterium]MBP3635534.1 peptide chain release factor 2 [Bacilli bacterium]
MIYGGYFDVTNKKKNMKNLEDKLQNLYRNNDYNSSKAIELSKQIGNDKKIIINIENLKLTLDSYMEVIDSNELDLINEIKNDLEKVTKSINILELETKLSSKNDKKNAILEIHPGAGGTESCDWADMLFRMYLRWCDKHDYKYEILDSLQGEEAGIKKVIVLIKGINAYGYLKCERGVHRLVRISPFDSQKRRHTSFAAIEVYPEANDDINIEIKESDIRVDVYRSSGAGGQGVNTTDSAVRITHIPTNIVVTCQNERSQLKNKEQALKVLKSKLYAKEEEKRLEESEEYKKAQSSINFGSQIRSYVMHPYSMVKDHRTNYETSNVNKVLDGDIDEFIEEYLKI